LRLATGTEKVGLIARTEVELAPGNYVAHITSDDGVRLMLDGRAVLENWSWHGATRDEARVAIAAGHHVFELEWFQIDGSAALTLDLERVD
jgi:hypothetical protein